MFRLIFYKSLRNRGIGVFSTEKLCGEKRPRVVVPGTRGNPSSRSSKKLLLIPLLAALASLLFSGQTWAANAVTLPTPLGTQDGIGYSIQADNFVSYSSGLLAELQGQGFLPVSTYGNYSKLNSGTGNIGLLLYTGATGQSNSKVDGGNGTTFSFPDPVVNSGGSVTTFSGTWNSPSASGGTVDNLLAYIQSFDPNNSIPVFYFDLNQTGSTPNLNISAYVQIVDGSGNNIAQWNFDDSPFGTGPSFLPPDDSYDKSRPDIAYGNITATGTSGYTYSVDNNKGSGHFDFIAYAPGMDLTQYANKGYYIQMHVDLGYKGTYPDGSTYDYPLNDGPEEIGIFGGIGTPQVVPEPTSFALLGIGFAGLFGYGWRRLNRVKT